MSLDTNYGSTQKEKEYVKDTLDKEGVKKLFEKELNNLSTKIIRNFHNDNYAAFEIQKTFDAEKKAMKDIITTDADMQAKYEAALAKNKARGGFSEGILLTQAIAVKCIQIINQSESVENKLTSWNGKAFKSESMDGIMGPNTFYVLASIAKERGIPFNGVIDKKLIDEMIKVCGEAPKETIKETTKTSAPSITEFNKKTIDIGTTINKPKFKNTIQPSFDFFTAPTNKPTIPMDKPISKPVESTGNKSDDVFTVIEQPNTKIDPSMYTDRKELSASEKDTVKEAYQNILAADKKETDIQTVINGLDAKTLAGLRDILVKKIVILKKAGNTESGRFQSIAQMIVSRQSEMLSSSK